MMGKTDSYTQVFKIHFSGQQLVFRGKASCVFESKEEPPASADKNVLMKKYTKPIPKKLKVKNMEREKELEERRNKARLSYPVDIRIDLSIIKYKANVIS